MKVSRRQFAILGGFGLAGLALATAPKLIWRAQGRTDRPFFQPPDLKNNSTQPGLVEFSLTASRNRIKLPSQDGLEAELMTYNGSFPGSTMRLKEGDRVRIEFRNDLEEPTNLHFHGLHISPTGRGDNVFRMVQPKETAIYEFETLPGSAGTYWYHPHHHGNVNTQVFAGLSGAIVVEPKAPLPELQNLSDHLIILQDLELDEAGNIPPLNPMEWMNGREGSTVMVNGAIQPTLNLKKGAGRLRFLNQSVARYYNLKLEGTSMTVIATDGHLADNPHAVESLLIAPGERYDVIVSAPQAGEVALIDRPYDRGMMGMGMMGKMHGSNRRTKAEALMYLSFSNSAPAPKFPASLQPIKVLSPKDAVQTRTINFTEQMGHMSSGMGMQHSGMGGMMSFSFNGQEFDPNRVDITAKLGTVELWELVNDTDMDHPFHLHVNAFLIYSRNGKREARTVWKDVVNVRSKETVQILIPFSDFTGKTMFHCHVLDHEELGMMGVVEMVT